MAAATACPLPRPDSGNDRQIAKMYRKCRGHEMKSKGADCPVSNTRIYSPKVVFYLFQILTTNSIFEFCYADLCQRKNFKKQSVIFCNYNILNSVISYDGQWNFFGEMSSEFYARAWQQCWSVRNSVERQVASEHFCKTNPNFLQNNQKLALK